ncbi:MAG: AAA family ATPase [Promethearchaeota archaeon]
MVNDSYITSLHAKEIGLFKELNIEFNQKFNFLIGPNGCGKTSIIRCLAIALDPRESIYFSRYGKDAEVWIDFRLDNEKYRLGAGRGFANNGNHYRNARVLQYKAPPAKKGRISLKTYTLEQKNLNFAPLIIGAYRRIDYQKIEGMKAFNPPTVQRNFYRTIAIKNLEGIFLPNVKQWLINKFFSIPQSWAKYERINWEWLLDNMKNIGPVDVDFNFIEIKKDLEPIFSINGVNCYIEELSAGYQSVLSLIFTIFDWIEGINEETDKIAQNAVGTVIIDELDIHMHPEWQFTIRKTLQKLFPKLQFIVTTHSPHLIGTAEPNEIIILPKFSRIINVKSSDRSYAGWTTDQILEDLMGVKSLKNILYEKLFNEARNAIEEKNIKELKRIILELENITHPSDTIVERLKIELSSLLLSDKND